jgi:chromosomal replication initiator protein
LLQEVERRVGSRNFCHWFGSSTTWRVDGDVVVVGVGSPFLQTWMQKQFRSDISAAAQSILGPSAGVRFEVEATAPANPERPSINGESPRARKDSQTPSASGPAPAEKPRAAPVEVSSMRKFASLNDFVVGKCNQVPMTVALQVCESPGTKYNPLFLHGPVGTGKTHLLEGMYGRLRRQFPSLKVMFLTAEAFANYFTEALREHKLPAFRRRFRGVDVLLVDDVDFLNSKRVIQEEFLHTVKQLESHQRQVVLTSDSHPRLLSKMSDELTTRFLSGMVCRFETPDRETRRQIVQTRAARLDAEISPEACAFVAQRFTNNVRELIGALNCLETHFHMTRQRVGLSAARQVLADLERDCVRVVRMADVEQTVCQFFGIEPGDLKSSRRDRSVSQPRMLAMFLARKHTQAAYREIGKYFGGRNHSTVKAAEQRVADWIQGNAALKIATHSWSMGQVLEALEQQLHAG